SSRRRHTRSKRDWSSDVCSSDLGHQQARAVAAGIAWLNSGLDAILTSPLPRAAQTAQPVAKALGLRLETVDALAPGHDPAEALRSEERRVGKEGRARGGAEGGRS